MVSTVQELEACVGKPMVGVQLKVIDHVEDHAARWIAAAPLAAVATAGKSGEVAATLAGGDPGFVRVIDKKTVTIARSALDASDHVAVGDGVACLFFVPAVTETLRITGRVQTHDSAHVTVAVDECFVHCGKALIRSRFWKPQSLGFLPSLPADARFCVLATADANGNADASPKGDPAGFISVLGPETFALPDRTGNRRADGHRNIIANERTALVAFAPGSTMAFVLAGRAKLTRDASLLTPMTIENKTPLLATVISADAVRSYESRALTRARVWDADRVPANPPSPAATLSAHVKLSQGKGIAGAATRFLVTPDIVEKGLAADYKANLY